MNTSAIDSVVHRGTEGRSALTITLFRRERGLAPAWLALLLLLGTSVLTSTAAAQQDDSQPQPRPRARAVAHQYPDDQMLLRTTAASNDAADAPPPLPLNIDSPSNQPVKRAKAKQSGDATDANVAGPAGETIPATRGSRTPFAPRRMEGEEGSQPVIERGEVFNEGGDDDDFGALVPNVRGALHDHLWVRADALLWWLKGSQTPALLTTSPASTPLSQAGVLPNATVLFGDQELNQGLHAGARISFGTWLGAGEESGIEFTYMIIGENSQSYNASSMGNPILARPFFNTTTGAEDSHIIAYPGVANGTFGATSTENFEGAEIVWRRAIVHPACDGRIDLLLGYRFNRLTDGLEVYDSTTGTSTPGTTIDTHDSFHTRNDFNGGELGFSTEMRNGRWSLETVLKMGVGATQSDVTINGATNINGTVSQGGLLALPSNIGQHDSSQFSVMPEIGFTLACDISPHLKASAGYTLLYWSNVARPGDQIDTNVDTNQFPPPLASGEKPAFVLHTSDFWAQGVNLGLDYRF